jgi:hypothetical protein
VFGFAEGSISLKFSECENRSAKTLFSPKSKAKRVKPEARGELEGKVNYFIGNDPAWWRTNIPTFQEVVYPEVYPGIDLVYSGNQRRLKYTFYIQPGSNPNQIQMIYDGIEGVWIDEATGELVIQTEWGEMRDAKPVAYQEIEGVRKEVSISFRLIGEKRVGFAVGNYDPNFRLIIDPGYSTYLGGSDNDFGYGISMDSFGNAYVTGYTYSSDFPTQNPFQGSKAGVWDAFVTKLENNGSTLSYSTYLGGSGDDGCYDIAVDGDGNAYVTGQTDSDNFPTLNPYQSSHAGNNDAFVASYLPDGSLPVELSLLTATASVDGVTLRWRTETEVNNIGFRIYRSEEKDGDYIRIAFVDGAGNSAMPIDYQFTDQKVEQGKTYFYYLEDIDIAGEKSRFEIIKVVVLPAKPVLPIPREFQLLQNYPNPFNPETWIPYELATDAAVTIRIYDVNGQLVRQLDLGKQKAGCYVDKRKAAYWDGKDQTGKAVSSGIYFYTLKADDFQATRRMVIVK